MTIFTSAELAALAEEIPNKAVDRGLLYVAEAEFVKSADVQLSAAMVSIDNALAIAISAQAVFVSLTVHKFDPDELREVIAQEDGEELPAEVNRLVSAAGSHDGEVDVLWLRWPAHGLIFEWTATCEWRESLFESLDTAMAETQRTMTLESLNHEIAQKVRIIELISALVTSPEFRGAPANKRRQVAESIIASVTKDEIEPYVVGEAASQAGRVADQNIFEYERKFQYQIQELADELKTLPDWKNATTMQRRREVAQTFLTHKADGYRIGPRIVGPVMEAARSAARDI
ncbi:hypothetical protein KNN17_10835 [Arthrobacter bambusae]|uniref:hypothetical protein n=1 Tax=Arthrobacter bambusae TaxID=1338426 RepID=UPI001F509AD9|nr:hypothetical protein [Arthrobacter bambusae]MCI0142074.1 hypothetical protein [Arthrobacter bambusae]